MNTIAYICTSSASLNLVKVHKVCIWPCGPSGWSSFGLLSYEGTRSSRYIYSPLDRIFVHRRVTSSIKFAGTHLDTWVERGTERVKQLAQEHTTMSMARAQTQTIWSEVEHINHETWLHLPLSLVQRFLSSVIHKGLSTPWHIITTEDWFLHVLTKLAFSVYTDCMRPE